MQAAPPFLANRTRHADAPVSDNVAPRHSAVGSNRCHNGTSKPRPSKASQGFLAAVHAELRPATPAGAGVSRPAPSVRQA